MKQFIGFLLLCALAGVSVITWAEELLRFGYADACPHMCPGERHEGFTVDIVRAVYEKLGYRVEFVESPWARAAQNAKVGLLNGVISAGKEEVPGMIFPENELAVQSDCFFGSYSDHWRAVDKPEHFLGRRTIVFKGWILERSYIKALGQQAYNQAFEEFSIDKKYGKRVMEMLRLKRADSFWMDSNVFAYSKLRYPGWFGVDIVNLGCVAFQDLYLALSPATPALSRQLAQQFDLEMPGLRNSGELDEILALYGLSDWRTGSADPER